MIFRRWMRTSLAIMAAVIIPGLLTLSAYAARGYMELENDVRSLEEKQEQLIKENERLINEISLLTSSARVKERAENDLGMHAAESGEIVRVQMKDADR